MGENKFGIDDIELKIGREYLRSMIVSVQSVLFLPEFVSVEKRTPDSPPYTDASYRPDGE